MTAAKCGRRAAIEVKILLREALGYTVVSAVALVVGIAILWMLVRYFSLPHLAAATGSFSVGLVVVYVLSVSLVFAQRRLKNQPLELGSFAVIGVVGLAVNAAAMLFGIRYLKIHYLLAKCGAAGFTFIWNFAARRQLLFVRRRAA
jgi:putative flippase GtrA